MAKICVKLFGVFRVDTGRAEIALEADRMGDIFPALQKELQTEKTASGLAFKDASVYINGESCRKKSKRLADGDEIWLLSPASGG